MAATMVGIAFSISRWSLRREACPPNPTSVPSSAVANDSALPASTDAHSAVDR